VKSRLGFPPVYAPCSVGFTSITPPTSGFLAWKIFPTVGFTPSSSDIVGSVSGLKLGSSSVSDGATTERLSDSSSLTSSEKLKNCPREEVGDMSSTLLFVLTNVASLVVHWFG
jgi:hypothetical protein